MLNNVVLIGRMTKDPDLRYTPNGVPVASFTIAVNRDFTNQNGDREADFANCVIWRKPAENVANYTHKGSLVCAVGRFTSRSYEGQDGKRVYVNEITCDMVYFLDPKNSSHGDGGNNYNHQHQNNQGQQHNQNQNQNRNNQNRNFNQNNNNQNRNNQGYNNQGNNNNNNNPGFTRIDEDPFAGTGQIDISDDDLPF